MYGVNLVVYNPSPGQPGKLYIGLPDTLQYRAGSCSLVATKLSALDYKCSTIYYSTWTRKVQVRHI